MNDKAAAFLRELLVARGYSTIDQYNRACDLVVELLGEDALGGDVYVPKPAREGVVIYHDFRSSVHGCPCKASGTEVR